MALTRGSAFKSNAVDPMALDFTVRFSCALRVGSNEICEHGRIYASSWSWSWSWNEEVVIPVHIIVHTRTVKSKTL